tara:strand:- start:323 stop:547 length:225 start_codon:yes stop_codon:yes gene_type:complete
MVLQMQLLKSMRVPISIGVSRRRKKRKRIRKNQRKVKRMMTLKNLKRRKRQKEQSLLKLTHLKPKKNLFLKTLV